MKAHVLRSALAVSIALCPALARAQELREAIEAEARTGLDADVQLELEAVEAQRRLVGELYIAAGVLFGVGLAAVLAGSIGTSVCPEDACTPWHATIGAGAGTASVGLGLFIPAATLDDGARARRRELLLEHLAIGPLRDGVVMTARWRL